MLLSGQIAGASSVIAEVDRVYTTYNSLTLTEINTIKTNLEDYMNTYSASAKTALLANLGDGDGNPLDPGTFHFRTGAVVQTTGDLILSQNWDLTQWRFGSDLEPGTLTLRAGGKLDINASIIDNPTNSISSLRSSTAKPSWGINLIAGAQTDSADLMAVTPVDLTAAPEDGRLTIASGKVVYTESGSISFASGGDTIMNASPQNSYMVAANMRYSLGTYAGAIEGDVKGSLTIAPSQSAGAAIQSATGDIDLVVGKDLILGKSSSGYLGAIRTTGEAAEGNTYLNYYTYQNGGDITIDVGGSVAGGLSTNWLTTYQDNKPVRGHKLVIPNYSTSGTTGTTTEGIAAMAGGNVYVKSGGAFNSQIGTFGEGNLSVYAGGDLTGRFYVKEGTAQLSTMGNFGVPHHWELGMVRYEAQLIEMADAVVRVYAQGNIELGAVVNPSLANAVTGSSWWDNTYTEQSAISLNAATGDVNVYGFVDTERYKGFSTTFQYDAQRTRNLILPPTVEITAGRDVSIYGSGGTYVQVPAETGSLSIIAGRDIVFAALNTGDLLPSWYMSDADVAQAYTVQASGNTQESDLQTHASSPVHADDTSPVVIAAGRDITNVTITLPKAAEVTAGRDIADLSYRGQNLQSGDVTSIVAVRDIVYGYGNDVETKKIELGGPGYLIVAAGGNVDLGNTDGIQATGNGKNLALSDTGASVIVMAGIEQSVTSSRIAAFFDELRDAGVEYTDLQAGGLAGEALARVAAARTDIIEPFLGSDYETGDITMTSSRISTTGGGSLYVMATGTFNVGKTELTPNDETVTSESKKAGVFTATGGTINVFAGGDVNVNESRIMTYYGGDITIWSDQGNVNAGRGDKAVVNMPEPTYETRDDGTVVETLSVPAVGSGVRTLSYDPDGAGPRTAPEPGAIYIFAPNGVIDAGEAGISGSRVTVGATAVLNASNISFTSGAVGVPTQSQSVSLGALTGTTSMAEKTAVSQDGGALGATGRQVGGRSLQPIEDVLVKWLDLKVISFDPGSGVVGESDDEEP
jgi:hypothetical protein